MYRFEPADEEHLYINAVSSCKLKQTTLSCLWLRRIWFLKLGYILCVVRGTTSYIRSTVFLRWLKEVLNRGLFNEKQLEVSCKAVSCPNCGAPIAGLSEGQVLNSKSTLQLTSNMLKMHTVLSSLLFWGGVVAAYNNWRDDPETTKYASIAILIGMVWYIVTKILTTETSRLDT